MKKLLPAIIIWILISMSAGLIGSQFLPGDWYTDLEKPAWNPPNSIFAPVWTFLYILMGIAAGLVWRKYGFKDAPVALTLFIIQLVLNALWSFLFFGIHQPGLAFMDITVLWLLILVTTIVFWRASLLAGLLLLPYLLWVSFAGILNLQLWRLNV